MDVIWPTDDGGFQLWCPGCKSSAGHLIIESYGWTFDHNLEQPTISPSLLVKWGNGQVCHSFITAGRIQFLTDSTHDLAGQTVDLVPRP